MKAQKTTLTKTILAIFLTLALAVCALGLISVNKVRAAESVKPNLVLPKTNLEYYQLNSPIYAYSDQDITAIILSDSVLGDEIILYKDGNFQEPIDNSTSGYVSSPKQIKRLNSDTLIFSSSGDINFLNVNTGEISEFMPSITSLGGNYFDFNDKYFVTVFSGKAVVYDFNNGQITQNSTFSLDADGDYSITINSNNEIFYINKNHTTLYKFNFIDTPKPLHENLAPQKMIANSQYVYYLEGDNVCRISVDGGEPQQLKLAPSNFDLGKITGAKSISFKGENLLITGNDAVQEFKITDNGELEFTGFAIAKNKSAFNRIDKSVKEIERENNVLATLDDKNLTLINISDDFNSYDSKNFTHVSTQELMNGAKTPSDFALGANSALFLYDNGADVSPLTIYDFNNKTLNTSISLNNKITDITYQSGKYYVLAHRDITNITEIYASDQNDINFKLLTTIQDINATMMEVDVSGNIYLYDNVNVYKLKSDGTLATLKAIAGAKKLETDLGGNLFVLTDNAIYYGNNLENKIDINTSGCALNSFAMDYDKKVVYMVCENEELILNTLALDNLSIDTLTTTQFTLTAPNASEIKAYSAKDGANVYSVSKTENGFIFNSLITEKTDYALVSEINGANGLKLYALVGQNDTVLINANDVQDATPEKITGVPENAFITTSVNGYYFPIITANSEYALTDGESVRLNKEQVIKPKHKITFLNKDYYFAEFTIGEKTYIGYVPVDYTIEILSQNFEWDNYTLENISKTTVYQEKELLNPVMELESGTSVRVISIENGIAYIAYKTEGGYINGYIDADCIQGGANTAIRNILIIIAVMASVCGTTTYFILRKKR